MSASRRRLLTGAAALAVVTAAGGCAAPANRVPPPAVPPPPPTVRVGDRWRYVRVNRYNGLAVGESTMRVLELAPQLRIEVVDVPGARVTHEIYAEPWRVVQEPAYDFVLVFPQPCPLLPSRLEPGARERWSGHYQLAGDTFRNYYWSVWVDAEDWERVVVPAGTFDALRVSRRIAYTSHDHGRLEPVRQETLWYAPQVNRWVIREWTGSYRVPGFPPTRNREDWIAWELVEYVQATA